MCLCLTICVYTNVLLQVGGVRTNFSMPDVLSLELGGGSTCLWNNSTVSSPSGHIVRFLSSLASQKLTLGPSVGHRLISEALCFGGNTCTATDVAVAAGVAPRNICQAPPTVLDSLNPTMVYRAISHIREMIQNGIDCVKVHYIHTALGFHMK